MSCHVTHTTLQYSTQCTGAAAQSTVQYGRGVRSRTVQQGGPDLFAKGAKNLAPGRTKEPKVYKGK